MRKFPAWISRLLFMFTLVVAPQYVQAAAGADLFLDLFSGEAGRVSNSLTIIENTWEPGYLAMTLETIRLSQDPAVIRSLLEVTEKKTGQAFGFDLNKWQEWMWTRPAEVHTSYARFKSRLYGLIDSRFANYFNNEYVARIRLDEVVWGGVLQDGIPPLRGPKMINATDADYLQDDHVVFGISVNNDARAYPKRILAWHEMFVDKVGGVPVAGVYCTLCGTVILYKTENNGVNHKLGTSGFLYRSNKLMFDQDTQSLWNTFWGEPVIGPLADQGIKLDYLSVVTTTWGEWRRRHPDTQVLSLDTGYSRDYSEGAAYRKYFATDELMFGVPALDTRLANKQEIFAVILRQHADKPVAISADYLIANPVYQGRVEDTGFVVLTDSGGGNRLYESGVTEFKSWNGADALIDYAGTTWTVSESELRSAGGERLFRLPAYRAFWFGWFSAYPHTRLIK